MRVTNKMMADNITAQLSRQTEMMAKTQEQIVTGKKINRASDDPSGISSVISYRQSIASLDQYNANISNAKLNIDTVDNVLQMVSDQLNQAKQIAYDTEPSMRTDMAEQVAAIRDQVLQMANYQVGGKYLFAGDETDTQPYNSTTWHYNGDAGTRDTVIGDNMQVNVTADGQSIFGLDATPTNVFEILNHLESALTADPVVTTDITDQIDNLQSAVDRITTIRTRNAGVYQRLDATANHYDYFKVNLQDMLSKTEDANAAEAIINFQVQQTTYESTLSTSAMILQKSLIDFLQ
jgi:flagellar hook-associated protein 3 FlgL